MSVERAPSAAEILAGLIALGQAAGSVTLLLLVAAGGPGADHQGLGAAGILAIAVFAALLGVLALISCIAALRGSLMARFAFVGAEIVLGAVGLGFFAGISSVLLGSVLAAILLMTVLSRVGGKG